MENKTKQLPTVRISEANHDIVRAAAEKKKMTISQWIHETVVKASRRTMGHK